MKSKGEWCQTCGRMVGVACACGMAYREKLLSISIDSSWMPAKSKKNYYDSEAIDGVFGEDSKEQLMEETQGLGAYTAEDRKRFPGVEDLYTTVGADIDGD